MAEKNIYQFDSEKHNLVIGTILVNDYADDVKITIAYDSEFKTVTKGVDGARSVNQSHDRDASIKVKILQNSPIVAILDKMAMADGKNGMFPVAYVNSSGDGTLGSFSSNAFFKKVPDRTIQQDAKGLEYEIHAINLKQA